MHEARRIYAFAYQKTGDAREAEDLSQEILLALFFSGIEEAENRKAYLYGVCRHVWARYLARNKPHWEAVRYASALDYIADSRGISDEIEKSAEYTELRREIARMSSTRREALVMRYFEEKSDAEIADALGISPATVRWHLHKARDELKGRLQMETRNGMRAPIRMEVGHSGSVVDQTMAGLKNDLLTQNVAWACYESAKRVEDIARELDVPAVYVEDKLNALAGMEYVKRIGDKYRADFFIQTPEYIRARARFNEKNTLPLAEAFFTATRAALPDIRKIGFVGYDLAESELIWHVLPELIMRAYRKINERLHEELNLRHGKPLRPDGTRHWVMAQVVPLPGMDDAALREYLLNDTFFHIRSMQADGAEVMQYHFLPLGNRRSFGTAELRNARIVARGGSDENVLRDAIAALSQDEYAENGKLMIPYLTNAERRTYNETLDNAIVALDMDALYSPFAAYAHKMEKNIPSFLNANERAHRLTSYDPFVTSIYLLLKEGKLVLPKANIAQRLSTVVWENT